LDEKEIKLEQIRKLLETYGGEIEIDEYILKYLSLEELEQIEYLLLKRQSDVIEDNSEWLNQFKKVL
jgi:hypothetical protein